MSHSQPFNCLSSETKRWIIGSLITGLLGGTIAFSSVSAKADRVIAIESKVDYIYSYLLEQNKK